MEVSRRDFLSVIGAASIPGAAFGLMAGRSSRDSGIDRSKPLFRPEDFALSGDSSDAPAINRAIQRANAAGGGTVTLDAKTYALDTSILMLSHVSLVGRGATKTAMKQTGTAASWAAVREGGIISTPPGGSVENIMIAQLSVTGLHSKPIRDGAAHYAKNGISIGNVRDSAILDCSVADVGSGIVLYGAPAIYRSNLIQGCTVRNAQSWTEGGNRGTPRGITMATEHSIVRNCSVSDSHSGFYVATEHGLYENCSASRWLDDGFYVNANYCTLRACRAIGADSRLEASGSGFAVNPCTGTQMIECVAEHCSNSGLRFRHAADAAPSMSRIVSCQFIDCGFGFLDDMTGANPYPSAVSRGNYFSRNAASNCQNNGFLFIRQMGATISGNQAINNNQAGASLSTRGGIALGEYCTDNVISDNVCDDTQAKKTQVFGFYSYPAELSGARQNNMGNKIRHRSRFGVDQF